MKIFLSLLLTALFILPLFTACKENVSGKEGSVTTQTPPSSNSQTTTEKKPNEEYPENTEPAFVFSLDILSQYSIIRPDNCGGTIINAVNKLSRDIANIYGVTLETGDDFFREGYSVIGEFEILVGATNREESKAFLSKLKIDDYGYELIGKKLVIAGHTPEMTVKAVDSFKENALKDASDSVFFTNESKLLHRSEYSVNKIKVNGIEINQYTIVYPNFGKNSEKLVAEKLKNDIINMSGYCLSVESDKTDYKGGYEIMIGNASHVPDSIKSSAASLGDDKYLITSSDKLIWLTSESVFGTKDAAEAFLDSVTPADGATDCDCVISGETAKEYKKETLSTMSYNVYVSGAGARKEKVIEMIRNYMPDTFGLQEASPEWMGYITEAFPEYAFVGEFRSGEGSEKAPVFYKKDKFKLIETDTKWLSDTPDTEGSKFEESGFSRIMTYAILENKENGKRFIHVNTHLDHIHSHIRTQQSKVLIELIKQLPKYPIILTGDFNAKSDSDAYKTVSSEFFNASSKVSSSLNVPTFHGFDGRTTIIDFVFFSSGSPVVIDLFKVCNEKIDGGFASDHHPVYCEYLMII